MQEFYAKASRICSRQEVCRADMMQKMRNWNISFSEKGEILDNLEAENFIDEQRYANAFVNDKFKFNKWGRIKISHNLRQKQISSSNIQNAINQIDENIYNSTLTSLLEKKTASISEPDIQKRKEKLIRFAISRGFETHLIILALQNIFPK